MERHYTDGTEPDVMPHVVCCNGLCEQGRRCPLRYPAEAATELGADDGSTSAAWGWAELFLAVVCLVVAAFIAGVSVGVFS